MEYWDLLDRRRRPLGQRIARQQTLPRGTYHAVCFVWIADPDGTFLLTRRAPEKKSYPNLWGCTGGAVQAGETSREAMARELWEETGLTARPEEFQLLRTLRQRQMFCDLYYLQLTQKPEVLRLQPGETVEAGWFSLQQIRQLAKSGQLAPPDCRRLRQLGRQLERVIKEKPVFYTRTHKKQE